MDTLQPKDVLQWSETYSEESGAGKITQHAAVAADLCETDYSLLCDSLLLKLTQTHLLCKLHRTLVGKLSHPELANMELPYIDVSYRNQHTHHRNQWAAGRAIKAVWPTC